MKLRPRSLRLALAALALGLSAVGASAAILIPGSNGDLFGTNETARPELGGVILADVLRPFTVSGANGRLFTGTLQDRVVRGADGGLIFYARIRGTNSVSDIDGNPPPIITGVSRTSFDYIPTVEAEFIADSVGTVGPGDAARMPGTGSVVGFDFHNNELPFGTDSLFFFVRTGATSFNDSGSFQISTTNSHTTVVRGFQPTIPEPASAALLALPALGLSTLVLRRPRRTA